MLNVNVNVISFLEMTQNFYKTAGTVVFSLNITQTRKTVV